jgi:hypothetical protein
VGTPATEIGFEFAIRRRFPTTYQTLRLVAVTIMQANELLEYELKQRELLDARIARRIKSCFELKAMEEMRSKT